MEEQLTDMEFKIMLAKLAHLAKKDKGVLRDLQSLIRSYEQQKAFEGVSFGNDSSTDMPWY